MSDWLEALNAACDAASQRKVAAEIGYSATVVNQVIHDRYPGDLEAVEIAVRGALMAEGHQCPGLGREIRADRCQHQQKQPLSASHPSDVKLWRACQGCCHRRRQGGDAS